MRHIESLRLTDFRSYTHLDLSLDGRPVVLFGPNGAGKTNLLEALSFLSPGRGLRRAKIDALARRHDGITAPAWGVTARLAARLESEMELGVEAETDHVKLAVGQVPEFPKRRIVRIDDRPARGAEMAGLVKMMWLTPAQDRLFLGPASDRRKFLDRFSLAHTPDHGLNSLRYEKARSERNRLLTDGISDRGWYEALERDMAVQAAKIATARVTTVNLIIDDIATYGSGAFPVADISLEGAAEDMAASGLSEADIEISIFEALARDRNLDMRAGRTLNGVHRSDLHVRYAAKDMPASACSTGEQKALLIGLILSHARAQSQHKPFLLLDEIAAHLDVQRRAALIETLLDLKSQVFMTGTDAHLFEAFNGRAQIFEIRDSQVTPIASSA